MMGQHKLSQKDFALKFLSVLFTAVLFIAGCNRQPSDANSSDIVLQHRLNAKVQTLDPADIGDVISDAVVEEIFECLY